MLNTADPVGQCNVMLPPDTVLSCQSVHAEPAAGSWEGSSSIIHAEGVRILINQ
jgi:hypothetical protein